MILSRSLLLLALASWAPALAAPQAPAEGVASPSAALERGLSAVVPEQISADLHFLASDAMGGRDTPSPQLEIASIFLRNRVQRLGFQPAAEDGWFYEYPLYRVHLDAAASSLRASTEGAEATFALGTDYFLQRSNHLIDVDLEAGVVCIGEGSSKDLEACDVEGKWALLSHGGRPLGSTVKRAAAAGALGLVATPGPDYSRDAYAERYTISLNFMLEGSATPNERKESDLLPQVMLARSGAAKLFALAGRAPGAPFPEVGEELPVRLHEVRKRAVSIQPVRNVCALWPGSDPELGKEVMIISAHYDHVGTSNKGEIFNGADDNGSGTSGVLALADALHAYGPLKRSVLLLWVSGEEKGLWGSEAWTKDPWLPEGMKPVLDLNIDMIGRTAPDELYITPSRDHQAYNSVAELAYSLSPLEGFPELQSQDDYWRRSDHMNFNDNLKIPVAFLSSGEHPDYHKPSDTPDKIDYEKLGRTVRLVLRMLDALQSATLSR
jgi:hypothetical protein